MGSGLGKMPVGAEPGRWDQEMAALPQLAFPSEPSHLPPRRCILPRSLPCRDPLLQTSPGKS